MAQEYGDVINLHDWYQSFRGIVGQQTVKDRNRSKVSPSPKKRKTAIEPQKKITEASIQYPFYFKMTILPLDFSLEVV